MNRKRLIVINSTVVAISTIVNLVLGLVEIRLFLFHYGSSINGLIQTGNQMLNYMALLEGGMCASYMFYMYKAVAREDVLELSSLYKGFKASVHRIVRYMLVVATIICVGYPLLLMKEKFSYFTILSILALLAIKMIIPYQISLVPKQMIILSEQKYKVEMITGISNASIYLSEILVILLLDVSVQILLIICIAISLLTGGVFLLTMKRLYSNKLLTNVQADVSPNKMSKDVMVHTISGLVFGSTDNTILAIFSSLNNVTIYSNYALLSSHAVSLCNKLVDGATASLGIKIARQDKNSYSVFRELFSGVLFISVFVTSTYIIMINDFISIWVGTKYCVNMINTILFGAILFCGLLLPSLQSLVGASGKFHESKWYIIAQAVLNLLLTIILVPFWGITGALIGTITARVFITVPFNYRTVYESIFKEERANWSELLVAPCLVVAICIMSSGINSILSGIIVTNNMYFDFLSKTAIVTIVGIAISFGYYYFWGNGFRELLKRLFVKH